MKKLIIFGNGEMSDISNYHKVAYTKYGHKKKVAGMLVEDIKYNRSFYISLIHFLSFGNLI